MSEEEDKRMEKQAEDEMNREIKIAVGDEHWGVFEAVVNHVFETRKIAVPIHLLIEEILRVMAVERIDDCWHIAEYLADAIEDRKADFEVPDGEPCRTIRGVAHCEACPQKSDMRSMRCPKCGNDMMNFGSSKGMEEHSCWGCGNMIEVPISKSSD